MTHAYPNQRQIQEQCYLRIEGIDQWVEILGSRSSNPIILILHGGPGYTMQEAEQRYKGVLLSSLRMLDPKRADVVQIDFRTSALDFQMPVIFAQGSGDHIAPTDLVAQYEKIISAPRRSLVRLDGGGHNAIFAMKDDFGRILNRCCSAAE